MNNPYEKLAEELDRIPNGFPRTKSGVELKLLAKLFSAEDATLASTLRLAPKSLEEIARENGMEETETKAMLVSMVKRGLIDLGILAAMAVNLIIALLMGVGLDAIFNVPFFAIK